MSQKKFERPQLLISLLPIAAKEAPSVPGSYTEHATGYGQEVLQSIRKTTPHWLRSLWQGRKQS